jgi:HK97 family phage major capsid protein
MTNPSARDLEAKLRASGMSREAARRAVFDFQTLSDQGTTQMNTTLLRAFNKFAPVYRHIAEITNTADSNYTVTSLKKARAAIHEGLDIYDGDNWDADFKLAKAAIGEMDRMIKAKEAAQAEAARTARPVEGQEQTGFTRGGWGAPLLRDVATGRMLRTYRHDEPVASNGGQPEWGIGDMVRAACTGDWSRLPANVRAGSAGIGASGGFLIPSEMAGFVIDLARAKARVLQAGAQTIPMDRGNLSVAVVTADPQAAWKAENAAFQVSQGSYGRIDMTTKTLGVIVPLSLELVMSAANLNEVVTTQLTRALGLQLDTAAIAGDGTQNQPRGIVSALPADHVVDVAAALASATAYGHWTKGIGKVLAANAELTDLSILHNSDVETALDGLQDTLNQPLRPTPNFATIKNAGRVLVANGITTTGSPAATYSLVGDFSQVLFGMQQSLSIEISRDGTYVNGDGSAGGAFAQGQVLLRAMIMCDVAVMRPAFFAQVKDIQIA